MDSAHQKIRLPGVSLRQLHYALAAADSGNVTEAARHLHVSQPAVSAAIAALEQHYGTALFTRMPGQGVAPTRFGRSLFAEIRGLLKQAHGVLAIAKTTGILRGEVTIGIYRALAPYYLPAILKRIEAELPDIAINFIEADLDSLVDRLHEGSSDLAITYDVGIDPELCVRRLYALRPFILVPRAHPLARKGRAHLRDLDGKPLVLMDQTASAHYVLGLLHARNVKPERVVRVQSFELQRSFVANGLGLALSHTRPLVATSYDGKELVAVPVSDRMEPQHVLLAASRRHRASAAAGAVADLVEKVFADLPQAAVDDRILITRKNVLK